MRGAGTYIRLQFLRAISHCLGAHTETFQQLEETSSDVETENDDDPTTAMSTATAPSAAPAIPTVPSSSGDAAAPGNCGVNSTCEVCLIATQSGVVLVPCEHARFCSECADRFCNGSWMPYLPYANSASYRLCVCFDFNDDFIDVQTTDLIWPPIWKWILLSLKLVVRLI